MCQPTCSFDLSHSKQLADNLNFGTAVAVAEFKKVGCWVRLKIQELARLIRMSISQAGRRGFDPRLPLQFSTTYEQPEMAYSICTPFTEKLTPPPIHSLPLSSIP